MYKIQFWDCHTTAWYAAFFYDLINFIDRCQDVINFSLAPEFLMVIRDSSDISAPIASVAVSINGVTAAADFVKNLVYMPGVLYITGTPCQLFVQIIFDMIEGGQNHIRIKIYINSGKFFLISDFFCISIPLRSSTL